MRRQLVTRIIIACSVSVVIQFSLWHGDDPEDRDDLDRIVHVLSFADKLPRLEHAVNCTRNAEIICV